MELQDIYNLIESHLENSIDREPQGKMKRVKLPIPKEYGGGVATGFGYEEAVTNLLKRVKEQLKAENRGPLFTECWEKWIDIKSGQEKAASTLGNYRWLANAYIIPFFNKKHIDEITADDIQKFFNKIMPLSRSISTQCKAILSGIFDRSVRLGHVARNPMLYKYERSGKVGEKVVLQDDDLVNVIEQLDVLKTTGDKRDYLYFCFLCFTALRKGEILGLRWEDINFETNEIFVRNNVTFPNGQNQPVVGKPKDDSYGVVHLQSELSARIKEFSAKDYILPFSEKERKKPMTRSMFTKMWARCNKLIDLKGATSHSFRASYATMMNAHCDHIDPKALQGALRHKTPDLAIKVYTKENENKTRQAEKEYDRWLTQKLAL